MIDKKLINASADITIYNYATHESHKEKGLVVIDSKSGFLKALGNECEQVPDSSPDLELVLPITMGKVTDYSLSEKYFKWLIDTKINKINGRRRLFKRSNKVLLYLHEPCNELEQNMYCDLMYMLGYRDINLCTVDTDFCGMTPNLWKAEEQLGKKLDCAIEIGKDNPS